MLRLLCTLAAALGLLTACPDAKPPKDPPRLPTPKTTPAGP